MKNADVRQEIKAHRLFQYEVAEELGVSACTFCVWMRHEMSPEKKDSVLAAIHRIAQEGAV